MKATVEVIMFFQVKTTAVDAFAAARVAASAACGRDYDIYYTGVFAPVTILNHHSRVTRK
jgi:hypothetical protein